MLSREGSSSRIGPRRKRDVALAVDELADVDEVVLDEDVLRPLHVGPLGEVLAGRAEDLDAVVLAIRDEDPPVGVDPGAVREVELAGTVPGLTPGLEELATVAEAVDATVAVAVRDVEVARRSHGEVGRTIERRARPG